MDATLQIVAGYNGQYQPQPCTLIIVLTRNWEVTNMSYHLERKVIIEHSW